MRPSFDTSLTAHLLRGERMSATSRSTIRRAAVSLNNTGVLLLERHCYQQAKATLTDALNTMKSAFTLASTPFQDSLKRSCKRMASPVIQRSAKVPIEITPVSPWEDPINVIQAARNLADSPPGETMTQFVALRINCDPCFGSSDAGNDMDLESSVILYNLALSIRILASRRAASTSPSQSHAAAIGLLRLSQALLMQRSRSQNMLVLTTSQSYGIILAVKALVTAALATMGYAEANASPTPQPWDALREVLVYFSGCLQHDHTGIKIPPAA